MCLTKPDPQPTRKRGVGYKSVEKKEDGIYTCYDSTPHQGSVTYPLNEWITDPNKGSADTNSRNFTYPVGFHILLRLPGIDSHLRSNYADKDVKVIKVKFRQVVATQTKDIDPTYGPQVVARQVMNLGEA